MNITKKLLVSWFGRGHRRPPSSPEVMEAHRREPKSREQTEIKDIAILCIATMSEVNGRWRLEKV
jgi:hypothetical protein